MPDMGEQVVGAYLLIEEECDLVTYNIRPDLWSTGELDVIGLRFSTMSAFLCEVTTHLDGLLIADKQKTVQKIVDKYDRQKEYADAKLQSFNVEFMFWSPVVKPSVLKAIRECDELEGLNLIINEDYSACVDCLSQRYLRNKKGRNKSTGNDFFRALQIVASLQQ